MEKLLVICGPTATGKTKLAIHLAKVLNGEIISADSRQVFKQMDIGTGKNLPKSPKIVAEKLLPPYYIIEGQRVWGYDIVSPTKTFSVAQFVYVAKKIIKDLESRDKLPIVVGGTGFYIKSLIDGIDTAWVKPIKDLRKIFNTLDKDELYGTLASIDPTKAAQMNVSDRNNPRRLVRAIEVAQTIMLVGNKGRSRKSKCDTLIIGITSDKKNLEKTINLRVKKRLKEGFVKEAKKLKLKKLSMQAFDTLGYKQIFQYLDSKMSFQEAVDRWKREEFNYAKRQLTWFKKDKRICWFDMNDEKLIDNVEKVAKKWYKK